MPRGRETKKGKSGAQVDYISRDHALSKLQISLKDFRKICILKGIYPREPPKSIKARRKTYYHRKDIMFIYHDPIVAQIRKYKVYRRKLKKARAKYNKDAEKSLRSQKPVYNFDHMIKERYGTFVEALRDLDDALCMMFLFATLPKNNRIQSHITSHAQRFCMEWLNYCIKARVLRKTFLSVKGIYYQVVVMGETVTWIAPYPFTQKVPKDIDIRIMLSFLEFHFRHLGFVLHRLYMDLGLAYPPLPNYTLQYSGETLSALTFQQTTKATSDASLLQSAPSAVQEQVDEQLDQDQVHQVVQQVETELQSTYGIQADAYEEEEEEEEKEEKDAFEQMLEEQSASKQSVLFRDMKVFIQRENLRDALHFALASCGAQVGWQGPGSPFDASDADISHVIVDRALTKEQKKHVMHIQFVQPQWVFDCINAEFLLDPSEYTPGLPLPAHLSPFVNDEEEGYIPDRKREIEEQKMGSAADKQEQDEDEPGDDDEDAEDMEERLAQGLAKEMGNVAASDQEEMQKKKKKKKKKRKQAEEKREREEEAMLASASMSRKNRRLYNRIQYSQKEKQATADLLADKKRALDKKKKKKNKKNKKKRRKTQDE